MGTRSSSSTSASRARPRRAREPFGRARPRHPRPLPRGPARSHVTGVSELLGIPKSTAHGILHAMRRHGYLTWDPSSRTLRDQPAARRAGAAAPVMELRTPRARRRLDRLATMLGETAIADRVRGSARAWRRFRRGRAPAQVRGPRRASAGRSTRPAEASSTSRSTPTTRFARCSATSIGARHRQDHHRHGRAPRGAGAGTPGRLGETARGDRRRRLRVCRAGHRSAPGGRRLDRRDRAELAPRGTAAEDRRGAREQARALSAEIAATAPVTGPGPGPSHDDRGDAAGYRDRRGPLKQGRSGRAPCASARSDDHRPDRAVVAGHGRVRSSVPAAASGRRLERSSTSRRTCCEQPGRRSSRRSRASCSRSDRSPDRDASSRSRGPGAAGLPAALDPVNAIPKIAMAPLLVVWMGFGHRPEDRDGGADLLLPDRHLDRAGAEVDACRAGRAAPVADPRRAQEFFKFGSRRDPQIFAGLKVAISLAVIGAVIAEFVGATQGLGYVIRSPARTPTPRWPSPRSRCSAS